MKKLYRVDVTVELVVAAESQAEAEREAEYQLVSVEDGGAEVLCMASPLNSARGLPSGWDAETIPFCGDDDKTIGEYFAPTPSGGVDGR